MNAIAGGHEVDVHWRGTSLVVELDSWTYHRSKRSFHADRAKWLDLRSQGFEVVPVTDAMLVREPDRLEAAIRDVVS